MVWESQQRDKSWADLASVPNSRRGFVAEASIAGGTVYHWLINQVAPGQLPRHLSLSPLLPPTSPRTFLSAFH